MNASMGFRVRRHADDQHVGSPLSNHRVDRRAVDARITIGNRAERTRGARDGLADGDADAA